MNKIIAFLLLVIITDTVMHLLGIEELLEKNLGKISGIGLFIAYAFKYHIPCCVIPAIIMKISRCKCHKECKHEHETT